MKWMTSRNVKWAQLFHTFKTVYFGILGERHFPSCDVAHLKSHRVAKKKERLAKWVSRDLNAEVGWAIVQYGNWYFLYVHRWKQQYHLSFTIGWSVSSGERKIEISRRKILSLNTLTFLPFLVWSLIFTQWHQLWTHGRDIQRAVWPPNKLPLVSRIVPTPSANDAGQSVAYYLLTHHLRMYIN